MAIDRRLGLGLGLADGVELGLGVWPGGAVRVVLDFGSVGIALVMGGLGLRHRGAFSCG
jgi:hypothetical protein